MKKEPSQQEKKQKNGVRDNEIVCWKGKAGIDLRK